MSICKNCSHRWYYGAKGQPNKQICTHVELPSGWSPSKNLKQCRGFKEVTKEQLNIIRKRTRN